VNESPAHPTQLWVIGAHLEPDDTTERETRWSFASSVFKSSGEFMPATPPTNQRLATPVAHSAIDGQQESVR
jgi:hypothetical protein